MILKVEAINTFYGKSHILQDISLNVKAGEVVGLLSRNGVGKTTTLRSIMGLTPPRNGEIRFKGEQAAGNPAYVMAKKGIAYMPDDLRIFPDLTCEENLEIAKRLSGRSGYWNRERVEVLFSALGGRPRQIINTNLKGYFLVTQAVAPRMIANGYGKIINMSSILGAVGLPQQVAYASAKGGIDQMTKVMALEWVKLGVRVNAVGPTYFETQLVTQIREDPERFKFINERTPMGRWGHLPELEGIIIFPASSVSDFITGQTIYVDGGWTIW